MRPGNNDSSITSCDRSRSERVYTYIHDTVEYMAGVARVQDRYPYASLHNRRICSSVTSVQPRLQPGQNIPRTVYLLSLTDRFVTGELWIYQPHMLSITNIDRFFSFFLSSVTRINCSCNLRRFAKKRLSVRNGVLFNFIQNNVSSQKIVIKYV